MKFLCAWVGWGGGGGEGVPRSLLRLLLLSLAEVPKLIARGKRGEGGGGLLVRRTYRGGETEKLGKGGKDEKIDSALGVAHARGPRRETEEAPLNSLGERTTPITISHTTSRSQVESLKGKHANDVKERDDVFRDRRRERPREGHGHAVRARVACGLRHCSAPERRRRRRRRR